MIESRSLPLAVLKARQAIAIQLTKALREGAIGLLAIQLSP